MILYFPYHLDQYFQTLGLDDFLADWLQDFVYLLRVLTDMFKLLVVLGDMLEESLSVLLQNESSFHSDDF